MQPSITMIITMTLIIIMIIIISPSSEIPDWHLAGDSRVSWVGRTLKSWLATFLGEGKL